MLVERDMVSSDGYDEECFSIPLGIIVVGVSS